MRSGNGEGKSAARSIPFPVEAVWQARGFSLVAWYAKHFGIRDQDVVEVDWLGDWIKRHHNRLRYEPLTCRWVWTDYAL